jgi:hypothetical protein
MKKIQLVLLGLTILVTLLSFDYIKTAKTFKSPLSNPNAPAGFSGAPTQNRTCVNCHGDFGLNTAGGSVTATGLPVGFYVPGQVYNFSVTITNAVPMTIWGFEMKAVTAGGSTAQGTFSTTNPNVIISSSEIKSGNAPVTAATTSYTFTNLKWTAPASGGATVSFYYTAVAGDNSGDETGDYVYSKTSLNITVPVTLSDFAGTIHDNAAILEWTTTSELNSSRFEVERSIDGKQFETISNIPAAGNSGTIKLYKYVDNQVPLTTQTVYYRLNMIDLDGRSAYSKVIALKPGLGIYISKLYPGVLKAGEQLNLELVSNTVQKASIGIYTSNGQLVKQQVEVLNKGTNHIIVSQFTKNAGGLYLLRVTAGGFTESRSFMVSGY